MNASPFDNSAVPESAGVSRRTIVGASATGLALALLARSVSQATAQDATPAAGGMPAGLAAFPLTNVPYPAADVPAGGSRSASTGSRSSRGVSPPIPATPTRSLPSSSQAP